MLEERHNLVTLTVSLGRFDGVKIVDVHPETRLLQFRGRLFVLQPDQPMQEMVGNKLVPVDDVARQAMEE